MLDCGDGSATLAWTGNGLRLERRAALSDGAAAVETETAAVADRTPPLLAVEHVSVGLELLEPEMSLELPGGRAYELSGVRGARPDAGPRHRVAGGAPS